MKTLLSFIMLFVLSSVCFAGGSIQLHTEFDRDPGNQEVFTVTVDHFSKWDFGKQYLFLDIMGKPDFKTEAGSMYFEYHHYLSADKMFGIHLPVSFIKDSFLAGQYNDSDKDSFGRVFLWGVSFDLDILNIDMLNLSGYVRDQVGQKDSYHFTLKWCEDFKIFGLNFSFPGFADYWKNDDGAVFIAEPQIRFSMSNFFPSGFLSQSTLGTEIEITHDFFGPQHGWEVNPTIMWVVKF